MNVAYLSACGKKRCCQFVEGRDCLNLLRYDIAWLPSGSAGSLWIIIIIGPEFVDVGFYRLYDPPDRDRQVVLCGGKPQPADAQGKALIKEIHQAGRQLNDDIKITYIPNYDMYRAKFLVSGVDVRLNTPLRPIEASGTSGMKAAANGVMNFSVLDGCGSKAISTA